MRLSIAAALLVTSIVSVARADPPRLVHRVDLDTGGPEKARAYGMTFLPDGSHVAVRWGWDRLRDYTSVTKLTVFGEPNRETETTPLPPLSFREGLFGGRIAAAKSGDILTPDGSSRLIVRPGAVKPDTPPTRQIVLNKGLPGATGNVSLVWLADADEAMFVAGRRLDAAYDLGRVEGNPLKDGKGQTKLLLKGGPREDMFLCADLHTSGKWFAASYASQRNENPCLDYWKVGEPASKKTVRLARVGQSVAIAPDAKTVAVGLDDGRVAYFATADLTPLREATQIGRFTVGSLAYHPRGRYLACATWDGMGADNLVVIDPLTGETPFRFAADPSGAVAVCFNADGSRMATFGSSGRVTIWDTSNLAAN